MIIATHRLEALQERLQNTDISTLAKNSGVSEIIIRRVMNGQEKELRSSTADRLFLVLKRESNHAI